MLTDRGRFALALGAAGYAAGWAFGSRALYPVALGLVLAVAAGVAWVRILARPVGLRRHVAATHVAGDDVAVRLELDVDGRIVPASMNLIERIDGLEERTVKLSRVAGGLAGEYVLEQVPRGRYLFAQARVALDDPFALVRRELDLAARDALLVYPRLAELEVLFSESGRRVREGRHLLVRRPSGFDLHSVREYEQGESLRRVHWPTTARRGQLMVKDLEDSPRDEALVVLDADAGHVVGVPPDTSFELAVSAAGSVLRAHAARRRRAGMLVNGAIARYQPVESLDAGWDAALELLATVTPDGRAPVAGVLAGGAGAAAAAVELCLVTSALSSRLSDRLLQRAFARRGTSVVYVDPTSFASGSASLPVEARAQIARLNHVGIPVCVLRRGDDLERSLGPALARAREAAGG